MIAVRYSSLRLIDRRYMMTYQGRATLPAREVTDATGAVLVAFRPVGYASVEVPEKTHPGAIRALLEAEYRAGRWWVFVSAGVGLPPQRRDVGVPLDPTAESPAVLDQQRPNSAVAPFVW